MKQSEIKTINLFSCILGKEMSIMVYLPGGYDNVTPVPVLYFHHGRNGNEHIMLDVNLNATADKMIEKGAIKPMIIVCPCMDNSRGLNSSFCYKVLPVPGGNNRVINLGMYEDYFIKEVIPYIDNTFCTIKKREGRYIGGASAGGYIALLYAFLHRGLFSKVGGHMPALELKLDEEDRLYYAEMGLMGRI